MQAPGEMANICILPGAKEVKNESTKLTKK